MIGTRVCAWRLLSVMPERVEQHQSMASRVHAIRRREHILQEKIVGKSPSRAEVRRVPWWPVSSRRQRQKRICNKHLVPKAVRINELSQMIGLPDIEERRV